MIWYQRYANKWKIGKYNKKSKPILQYSLDWNFIKEWENAKEVKKALSIWSSEIAKVCKFRDKRAWEFQWRYKQAWTEIENNIPKYEKNYESNTGKNNKTSRAVLQFTLTNIFIREWDCLKDVQRELKITTSNLSGCCRSWKKKTAGWFIWEYKDKKEQIN